jgi:GTP-binding protein LepA
MSDLERIRNFCIVAHIDHGKSTLADRLIELTGTVAKRDMKEQLLDSMDIERERGITIKLTPTKMKYTKNGKEYILNLIDTPGHVDFTYEVSRSLAACEGAILIVDATQGVQAQTINNVYLAIENNLTILPVINKIDLSSARPEESKKEIEDIIGIDASSAPLISAKTGLNVNQVLDQIVDLIPSPKGDENGILKALIFDSYYDNYKGAICMVRLFDGKVKAGTKIYMMGSQKSFEVVEVGTFDPEPTPVSELKAGEVGYIAASIKTVNDCRDGDTITYDDNRLSTPLPGYKVIQPVVFSGIFLVDGSKFNELKDALEKLKLSDASLTFEQEVSAALGFGFRCGFLGLLHMDVITERLEREFNLDIITTAPSVNYRITKINGEVVYISNPSELPLMPQIQKWEEPFVKLEVYTPPDYVGPIMQLCQDRRGEFKDMQYLDKSRARITYEIPLNEIVYDFFDTLKSISKGYASMDYEFIDYRVGDLVKLDILLNNEVCDALSLIVHKDDSYNRGRAIVDKLKDLIPRQMFEVPVQAAIGGKIIARETVKAWRKDVLAKCYGGDVTRKRKLLEKQKEGKKRMRKVGTVELPAEAFISILKV